MLAQIVVYSPEETSTYNQQITNNVLSDSKVLECTVCSYESHPTKSRSILQYSFLLQRSFKKMKAIATVNRASALRSNDVFIAVVWSRPFNKSKGAIIEPQIITKDSVL
jgi:hypothetical protein